VGRLCGEWAYEVQKPQGENQSWEPGVRESYYALRGVMTVKRTGEENRLGSRGTRAQKVGQRQVEDISTFKNGLPKTIRHRNGLKGNRRVEERNREDESRGEPRGFKGANKGKRPRCGEHYVRIWVRILAPSMGKRKEKIKGAETSRRPNISLARPSAMKEACKRGTFKY